MSGSFGEMGNLLAAAQKMQKAMEEARKELETTPVEGTAGGGVVRVTVTGDLRTRSVEIDEQAWGMGREAVEELLQAALADGFTKADRLRSERLGQVTGGLNLPGMF